MIILLWIFAFFNTENNRENIVDILAKNCEEKSKMTNLRDQYKEDHGQVKRFIYQFADFFF